MKTKEEKIREKRYYYQEFSMYHRKIEEFKTAEERVVWLLANIKHLRNCDKCLLHQYWNNVDGATPFHDRTSAETITRCRRFIQNELKLFQAVEKIKEARTESQTAVHSYFGEKK